MKTIIQSSKAKLFLVFFLACLFSTSAVAQTEKISGQVVDQSNAAVIGATVQAIGSKAGTVTDLNGHFSIDVKSGTRLHITYVGFHSADVAAHDGMRVVLKDETNQLNEVVAIGYGSVRRRDVTTAVSTVSTADLDTRPVVLHFREWKGRLQDFRSHRRMANLVLHPQSVSVEQPPLMGATRLCMSWMVFL